MKDSSKDIKAKDLPQENQRENLEDATRTIQQENPQETQKENILTGSDEENCVKAQVADENIAAQPLVKAQGDTENSITETPPRTQKPNLYSSAKVSVKVLDMAIVVLIGILILVFVYLTSKPGLTIYFDTDGGSRVENAQYLHGEEIKQPTAPVKEGYSFTGWYKDQDCKQPWDFSKDRVEQSFTLYAGWEKKT